MEILEGRWDCSNCGVDEIPGGSEACPNCGDPRESHEAPYLIGNETPVTDTELLKLARSGKDWECSYCESVNKEVRDTCRTCGGSKDRRTFTGANEPSGIYTDGARDRFNQSTTSFGNSTPIRRRAARSFQTPSILPIQTLNSRQLWVAVAGGFGALLILWLLVWSLFFKTTPTTLTVTELEWSRSVEVEEYRTLTEENWDIPSGGREIDSFSAIREYEEQYSHTEQRSRQVSERVYAGEDRVSQTCTRDLGNGFFESYDCSYSTPRYETQYRTEYYSEDIYVDVPIYDTKYRYEIERWVTDDWVTVSSTTDPSVVPFWPEPEIVEETRRVGNETREEYVVHLSNEEGITFEEEPGLATWLLLEEGQEIQGEMNRQKTLRSVDWPDQ